MHIKTVPIFKYPFLKDSPVHLKVPHCRYLAKKSHKSPIIMQRILYGRIFCALRGFWARTKISREVLHQVQNKPENAHYCTKGLRLHEIRQL